MGDWGEELHTPPDDQHDPAGQEAPRGRVQEEFPGGAEQAGAVEIGEQRQIAARAATSIPKAPATAASSFASQPGNSWERAVTTS